MTTHHPKPKSGITFKILGVIVEILSDDRSVFVREDHPHGVCYILLPLRGPDRIVVRVDKGDAQRGAGVPCNPHTINPPMLCFDVNGEPSVPCLQQSSEP